MIWVRFLESHSTGKNRAGIWIIKLIKNVAKEKINYSPGWVNGWVGVKAILKIAYSNQKYIRISQCMIQIYIYIDWISEGR